ncbi:hypothetical protein UAJ10_12915 [Nitrospirillum sp. BR 11164]|uniref:hypothetical protein n=1 Tax=Nitrospirillum sp. BR 11164 TaxID=3104324 RepID=UPI002AFF6497|nr:hypothetical protein [Nitrospirillum sp. BR 11164]MEA1649911.1 hypothetical protein [Nitrospirillum sp. BR 11164]
MLAMGICAAQPAGAEPTSGVVHITSVRVYANGTNSAAFVAVDSTTFCSTDTFAINLGDTYSGPSLLSAALSAQAQGKRVTLEAANGTGCAGWGTKLQSITILTN